MVKLACRLKTETLPTTYVYHDGESNFRIFPKVGECRPLPLLRLFVGNSVFQHSHHGRPEGALAPPWKIRRLKKNMKKKQN